MKNNNRATISKQLPQLDMFTTLEFALNSNEPQLLTDFDQDNRRASVSRPKRKFVPKHKR